MREFMRLVSGRLPPSKKLGNGTSRFIKSLSAPSLDDAWSILAEDALAGWKGRDKSGMVERSQRIKRKNASDDLAVKLIIKIASGKERNAIEFVESEGVDYMRPEWIANCLLAAQFSSQWSLAMRIGRAVVENPRLLAGAAFAGVAAQEPFNGEDASASELAPRAEATGIDKETPLLAAIKHARNDLGVLLMRGGVDLSKSAALLREMRGKGTRAFSKTASGWDEGLVDTAEASVLSFCIEGGKPEDFASALIARIHNEGPNALGAPLLNSMAVLQKIVSFGRSHAVFEFLDADRGDALAALATLVGKSPAEDVAFLLRRMIMNGMDVAANWMVDAVGSGNEGISPFDLPAFSVMDGGPAAVDLAVKAQKWGLAERLVAAGANFWSKRRSVESWREGREDEDPKSALDLAIAMGASPLVSAMLEKMGDSGKLAGFFAQNDGASLARQAAMHGFYDVAASLVRAGADIAGDSACQNLSSAMMWSCQSENAQLAVIERLREHPSATRLAAIEALDEYGKGALARAAWNDKPSIAEALIKEGANIAAAAKQIGRPSAALSLLTEVCSSAPSPCLPEALVVDGLALVAAKARARVIQAGSGGKLAAARRASPREQ